jgi:oxygen-independent coproporphyrinogen-3 oxidase
MGVQSFNDSELEFLGRIHNSGEAEKAVRLARDSGFENIGIDLIYGIPGQDITSWQESLNMAVSLKPEHISTYELTVEKGTALHKLLINPPIYKGGQRGGNVNLLQEDRIIEMYERTIDYLTSEGYLHYEISNFAKPGCLSRHNLNYWNRGEYYGTGQGAHSFMNGKRYHNTSSLDEYINAVSENISHLEDPEDISEEAALQEAIFLGLRKTSGLNLEKFSKRYKTNLVSHYQEQIKELQKAGLVEITASDCSYETDLRLTRKGLLLSNEVFIKFM